MNKIPFIWGHRGASGLAPENTLSAFALAEQSGADGVELDVHLSRDGVPIVIHDETLDRTTNGSGAVSDWTLRSLKSLDAGGWFGPDFSGEPLPTLEDVLLWADDRLRLNIEIKSAQAGRAVLDLLVQFPRARVLISSFHHPLLFSLRQWSPELPLAFLVHSGCWRIPLQRAIACRAESFHPPVQHVSRLLVKACHRNGLTVYPWTADGHSLQRRLLRIGVDGLFTNYPHK